jgi:two-component system phosphate regulon sensor histidine kinase PhoR
MKPKLTPLRAKLYLTLAVSAVSAAGYGLILGLSWGWAGWVVGTAMVQFAGVSVLLDWWVYGRVAQIQRRVQVLARRASLPVSLATSPEADDPLTRVETAISNVSSAIRREMSQMKETDSIRREFIGNISHELKTPIFAIEGYIETLLDGALDDKRVNKRFLKQALKNAQRLNSLVQDLLTISQLEAGELPLYPEAFSIYELALDVFENLDYKRTTKGRHIEFSLRANGHERTLVYADPMRIRQVLDNLVTNAIKYGRHDGLITIELQTAPDDKLAVVVQDNGPGIAPEHLPQLFDRFYRVEKSRSRDLGGTGLGLAIVKQLVRAHGQEIAVGSELDKGTAFEFTLPLHHS